MLTLAPSRMRQPKRKENGTSPGQHAVDAASGREMSYSPPSSDGFIALCQLFVVAGLQEVLEHVHRAPAFGERRVQRRRGQAQKVGWAEVRDHAVRPQRPRNSPRL